MNTYTFRLCVCDAKGAGREAEQCVHHYVNEGQLHWELLGILTVTMDNRVIDVGRVVKESRDRWLPLLSMCGWAAQSMLIPSKKAVLWSQQNAETEERLVATGFTRDAWTVSTPGLLVLLAFWVKHTRGADSRASSAMPS